MGAGSALGVVRVGQAGGALAVGVGGGADEDAANGFVIRPFTDLAHDGFRVRE